MVLAPLRKNLIRTIMETEELQVSTLRLQERKVVSVALLIVLAIGLLDLFEDRSQGIEFWIVIFDVLYVTTMVSLLAYIWWQVPLSRKKHVDLLAKQRDQQRDDALVWKNRAGEILQGLGKMIDQQLSDWRLSAAEKQIALLLLKGFSLKEIAIMRGTKALTVRQQATTVYQKAKLAGRSELSAFFLEDLLLPVKAND